MDFQVTDYQTHPIQSVPSEAALKMLRRSHHSAAPHLPTPAPQTSLSPQHSIPDPSKIQPLDLNHRLKHPTPASLTQHHRQKRASDLGYPDHHLIPNYQSQPEPDSHLSHRPSLHR